MLSVLQAAVAGAAAAQVADPGEPAAPAGPPLTQWWYTPGPGTQPALTRLQPHTRAGGDQGVALHSPQGIPQRTRGEEQDVEEKVCKRTLCLRSVKHSVATFYIQ